MFGLHQTKTGNFDPLVHVVEDLGNETHLQVYQII